MTIQVYELPKPLEGPPRFLIVVSEGKEVLARKVVCGTLIDDQP